MNRFVLLVLAGVLLVGFYACTHKPFTKLPTVQKGDTTTNTNTTHQDTTISVVTDTTVCFGRDVLPIFTGSCAKSGCHDAVTQADGYNLSAYANIISRGLVKGNSAASKIYTKCVSGKMPQYPTPRLDSAQLSYLKRWIDMGAPNDTNCAVICDTTKYTYSNGVAPILKKYCYSCHAAAAAASTGGSIVLDNYNGLLTQAQNGKLLGDLQHATSYNPMPQGGGKLPDCMITQVKKWIDAGAQNN